jgi:uncharacterized protein
VDNCRGLFAFASTALVLSLYNVHARHITVPNAAVGMALFYGGLAEFLAGMWAFAAGNVFDATSECQAFFHRSGSFHGTWFEVPPPPFRRGSGMISSFLTAHLLSLSMC